MTEYAFVTDWRLEAPIDDVFALIHDSLAWPQWWPAVSAVTEVSADPGPSGVGGVRRYTFRGPFVLPLVRPAGHTRGATTHPRGPGER